ncbi:MAG: ribulose-phosphate 3-epimerase [Candidatus Sericytochromatia bacterium]|nr:MAG: ribulose-phosphate 3-epimerase [Candidatus Sericytochromatia bacterium]GIX41950.1 MAG: ribulose-phosphate 3-epimerase [Leptospiraceae bacterium]
MKISPSILAADLTDLKTVLQILEGKVDFLHLDIMDGHFVPTLSFGEVYVKLLNEHTQIPLDVHLMVDQPEKEVPKYFDFKPFNITFHYEATNFPVRLAREIRKQNIKAGISLNPKTPVELIEPFLEELDLVLIMSVEPGFYGQSFIPFCLDKIKKLKDFIIRKNLDILIEVDGGINKNNINSIKEAGADIIVAGSFIFKGNIEENIQCFKINY